MRQGVTTSGYNISEISMGSMVMEYEPSIVDIGLFVDTPLDLDFEEKNPQISEESKSELSTIYFQDSFFILKQPLQVDMTFEDDVWFIRNHMLNINVWGSSVDEAIDAFNFAFYSIYRNFGIEDNERLSPEGIELKNSITEIILFSNESSEY